MQENEVYLHIGLFKTGTSFLQAEIFPNMEGITYFASDENWLRYIWDMNSRAGHELVDWPCPELPSGKLVVSREDLMGSPFHNYVNAPAVLNKLANDLPQAKVLVTIRRQDNYVESLYRQHIQTGGVQSVKRFLNFDGEDYKEFSFKSGITLDVGTLNYHKLIGWIEGVFGADRVQVIPYELMVKDKGSFYAKLASWMGVEHIDPDKLKKSKSVNKSIGKPGLILSRYLNRLIGGTEMSGFGLIPEMPGREWLLKRYKTNKIAGVLLVLSSKISVRNLVQNGFDKIFYRKGKVVSKEHRDRIMRLHAESNRLLDEQHNLGLKELGYYSD